MDAVGNGWHIHSSVSQDGRNLMAGGDGPSGMTPEGEGWVAGMLRDLPALSAVAAPSMVSLLRRRPGYFAGAFAFWGVQNREASLRFIPGWGLVPEEAANVELKASDASGNPYLALAAVIGAGMAGLEEGLTLPEPIQDEPGSWAYFSFGHKYPLKAAATKQAAASCNACHQTSAAKDDVFSQYYPVLRAAAPRSK